MPSFSSRLTFSALVLQAREAALFAFASELPFERLVEELRPERDLSRSPLVQVVFQLLNLPATRLDLPELTLTAIEQEGQTAKFDLVTNLVGDERGRSGVWHYSTALFDRSTVVRMAGHFTTLLVAVLAEPDRPVAELPLLGEGERHQLLAEWNAGPEVRPPSDRAAAVHDRFAAHAARRPDALALSAEGAALSYGELAREARRLACFLVARGVGTGSLVGLCLERSLDLVVAIVGVLEAGAAYVPLDPGYPKERLAFVLEDSGLSILLTASDAAASLPTPLFGLEIVDLAEVRKRLASTKGEPAVVRAMPEDLAYVIYTSGSTGRPKAVGVRHAQVSRLLDATDPWFGFGPEDVWPLFHSYAFDFSVWELWGALAYGGRLLVVPYWSSRSPEAFRDLLWRERVTVLNQTPSAFRQLIWAEEAALTRGTGALDLRLVIFGGEALEIQSLAPWWERHGDRHPRLVNMYGITETTVHVTYRKLGMRDLASAGSLIGRPIPDLSVHLLDVGGLPVPIGVAGELHVGGAGLAVGYLGRPALTAERFVPDPWGSPGERLYRSGDLARRLSGGDLEYLGRIDQQVKIRGFRIELGEIESALARETGVRDAVVLAREDSGERRLVAYLVMAAESAPKPASDLRARVSRWLPDHMLPTSWIVLPELPLTPSGKVDRRALSLLPVEADGIVERPEVVPPRTALERFLAELWRAVLPAAPPFGVEDDFFTLGGNSISGAVLINRLQSELQEIVHVVTIFDAPTIAALAAHVGAQHQAAALRLWGRESLADAADDGRTGPARVTEERVAELQRRVRPLGPGRGTRGLKNPRAVFILSPPRSGSTLLRVMLGGLPRLFAPPELELLSFRSLRERRAAFSGRDSLWLEGAVRAVMEARGWGAERAAARIEACERQGFSTRRFYGLLQGWLGGRLLVDKTPSYSLDPAVLARAEEEFAGAFYVHLIRHPHGMIHSFEEAKLDQLFFRQEHPFTRRELAELIWLTSHRNIRDFLAKVPRERQHQVRFEDLTRQPESALRALCAILGEEFDAAMLRPYEDGRRRMTDGLHAESRMLGDVKFHSHREIEGEVAERWRETPGEDFLGEPTWDLAVTFGYPRLVGTPLVGEPGYERLISRPIRPIGPRQPGEAWIPLSFAQERLWFLDQLDPGSSTYNIPVALRLRGPLHVPILAASLQEVVRRHEALRTTFLQTADGPLQVVAAAPLLPVPRVDLTGVSLALRQGEVSRLTQAEAGRAFDLERGPLLRATLLAEAVGESVVLLTLHHVVSDGWSMGVLIDEMGALYASYLAGRPSPLVELAVQYADFSIWQRGTLSEEILASELAYWREALAGLESLELPTDRPRPAVRRGRGAMRRFHLPETTSEGLARLGRASGSTPFMTLLAGFVALLSRLTGQDDVAVGTPLANRTQLELEGLIGFFVNPVVLRPAAAGDPPFAELLAAARRTALAAYQHQEVPFERVVEELSPRRDPGRTPLFQVMLTLQNLERGKLELPGLSVERVGETGQTSKFDLTLSLAADTDVWSGGWEYDRDLFDPTTIERFSRCFETLLAGAVAMPPSRLSDLPVLGAAECHQLRFEWRGAGTAYPREGTVHALVEAQASSRPEAVAAVFGSAALSYGELACRAGRLAWRLRGLGVGAEVVVGLCLERSFDWLVGGLGILLAGGAYLPLDPSYPRERLALLATAVPVVVTASRWSGVAPSSPIPLWLDGPDDGFRVPERRAPASLASTSENLAYVIYTSGSTGEPKGVAVPHRAVVRLIRETDYAQLGPSDRVAHLANTAFDAATFEVWGALANGGTLEIVGWEEVLSPLRLAGLLAERRVTTLFLTTALFNQMAGEVPAAFGAATHVLFGGEAVDPDSVRRVLAAGPPSRLIHVYGPTENTTFSTWFPIGGLASVPAGAATVAIGRTVANSTLQILDRGGEPVPVGVVGELYVGGDGLARCYLGRPEQSAERFVPSPYDAPGERLYRTGDRVRLLPSGAVEFLGRLDRQVKIRGFRVEPGEVEAVLAGHPEVGQAVVLVREERPGDRRLVAYLEPRPGAELSASSLRVYAKDRLSEAMVPSAFVLLASLPLTLNGKVDRRALSELLALEEERSAGYRAPGRPVEELLAIVWGELLGVAEARVGRRLLRSGRPLSSRHPAELADRRDLRRRAAAAADLRVADAGGPGGRDRGRAVGRGGRATAPPRGRARRCGAAVVRPGTSMVHRPARSRQLGLQHSVGAALAGSAPGPGDGGEPPGGRAAA